MTRRIVVDTNLWIRALLGGPVTLPVLEAWRAGKFVVLISQPLLDELEGRHDRLRPPAVRDIRPAGPPRSAGRP